MKTRSKTRVKQKISKKKDGAALVFQASARYAARKPVQQQTSDSNLLKNLSSRSTI